MPKRPTSFKPSSKPSGRRGHSYSAVTGNCNAIHLSLPFPSFSSSSLSSSFPSSHSFTTTAISSADSCISASSSAFVDCSNLLASSLSSSSSISGPSSSSSSSSSCTVSSSFSVTCLEMETSEASCSVSYRQVAQQDVLYEYVKGLQEANKSLDVDVAERVMQELAESMTSPAAAALVVSSGGARLIASAVKQFKSHGLQKTSISRGKGSKAGSKPNSVSIASDADSRLEVEVPPQVIIQSPFTDANQESIHPLCTDTNHLSATEEVSVEEGQPPHPGGPAFNEARRKRQRTSEELMEFENCKGECACKSKHEMYTPPLFMEENGIVKNSTADLNIHRPSQGAMNFTSRSSSIQDLHGDIGSFDGELLSSTLDEVGKGRTDCHEQRDHRCPKNFQLNTRCRQVDKNAKDHAGSSQITAGDILINMSKNFGDVSRTLLEVMVDEVCESGTASRRSTEIDAAIVNGLQGMVTASVQSSPLGSTPQCTISLTKKRESVRLQKQSGNGSCVRGNEKNKGRALRLTSNGVVAEVKQKKSSTSLSRVRALKTLAGQRSNEAACDACLLAECHLIREAEERRDSPRTGKERQGEQEKSYGMESSIRLKKDVILEKQDKPLDGFSTSKATGERSVGDEAKVELPNVLDLAKEAGLPDVVAAACHALDKLINAALQGKGASVANSSVTVPYPPPGRRRGKVLPAELYVALTEALVEIVQVFKDQVELLCWCLDCLGSILPPTSNSRPSYDGFLNSSCTGLDSFFSSKDLLHATGCKSNRLEGVDAGKQSTCHQSELKSNSQLPKSAAVAVGDEMTPKTMLKSFSGAVSSDTDQTACDNACSSSSKSAIGLGSSLCSSISSGPAANSISALAAVAYTATVPMLAEKAVKAILSAIQPCDIEPHSTQAALHALSAHLSSTNSKYVCDDVIAFIIAAMREFKTDAEMQTESCTALASLNRAISSATGHCAWSTIMDTMDTHQANIVVQRAGCSALHVLCTRAGLNVLEWGSGKRPVRAGKDTDREAGVRALVSAMLSFPEDVRIQWHGCSALWTLVHSAGTRSVANMVCSGALCAVTGAMRVCRTNEMMQQEGCNVIGTMARTLVESGHEFGPRWTSDKSNPLTELKRSDRHIDGDQILGKTSVHGSNEQKERFLGSSEEWWDALKVVVAAMRAFSKSKSVQSNGIFALGCILKGSMVESIHPGVIASSVSSVPGTLFGNSKLFTCDGIASLCGSDAPSSNESQKGFSPLLNARSFLEQAGLEHAETLACLGKDIIDDIERLNEAVEVTMAAMPEFPKIETIQVWGCAVLQQAFLAYVHYSKRVMPLSPIGMVDSGSSQGGLPCKSLAQATSDTAILSPASALANLVLSQATSTMFMISGMMALSYSGTAANGDGQDKVALNFPPKASLKPTASKSVGVKSQGSQMNQSFVSVRQSWCAALGAIGDVFGHLTQNTEVSIGKSLPTMSDTLDATVTTSSADYSNVGTPASKAKVTEKVTRHSKEVEDECMGNEGDGLLYESATPRRHPTSLHDVKQNYFMSGSSRSVHFPSFRLVEASKDTDLNGRSENRVLSCCLKSEGKEQELSKTEWDDMDGFSQQQVINDIKAWQEATESLAKIAERVGFPMSVKNAILAIRTILYKLEDSETVIWACHALVGLYLTWENVHLFKPGLENDREEYKAKIWGEGDVGVRQLVYLVSYWTKQSRADVMSLALQALYSACVFAATIREIEEVFAPADCGTEAVLGAMQKVLGSGGSLSQRKKVVQQACCVLTVVCGYSIPVQVGFAAAGGADIVVSALDRYYEDNEVLMNGLHALGLDSRSQSDFDALWNAALYRSNPNSGGKGSRKKRGGSISGSVAVGLSHVFKEGATVSSSVVPTLVDERGAVDDVSLDSECLGNLRWAPQLERLVFDGTSQTGRFLTWLIAGPGCGGTAFAIEVLKRLNAMSQKHSSLSEMQGHVCLVIGYMSAHNSKWRQDFLDSGGLEAVLACMKDVYGYRADNPLSLPMFINGVEKTLCFDKSEVEATSFIARGKMEMVSSQNLNQEDRCLDYGPGSSIYARVQYAACIALTSLVKDDKGSFSVSVNFIIKALVLALHRYGGLSHLELHISRAEKVHSEVCAPARLALARLGVSRIGDVKMKHLAHEAADAGDLTSLEALGQKGVDLMAVDGSGHTPLWYAEQSGQTKAAQYLKEQAQLCVRRRVREKAKAKSRRGMSKDDSQLANAQNVEHLQVSQEITSLQEQLDEPQLVEVQNNEKKLQVLQERNFQQAQISAAEQTAKDSLKIISSKENFIAEADCCRPVSHNQEAEACNGASKNASASLASNFQTLAIDVIEVDSKKFAGKKRSKGAKRSQSKEQNWKKDSASSLALETSATSGLLHQANAPFSMCDEPADGLKEGYLVKHTINSKHEQICKLVTEVSASGVVDSIKAAEPACQELPNATAFSVKPRDDINERSAENKPVESDAAASEKIKKSDHANQLLHEALVSGVIENLEAALETCEDPESGADDVLLKKVRAALAKRLKRIEKSAVLQEELLAAVEEGSSPRLYAAILAIEKIPRFAAAFSEKLIAARQLLFEIESKERVMRREEVTDDSCTDAALKHRSADAVPLLQSEDGGSGHDNLQVTRNPLQRKGRVDAEGGVEIQTVLRGTPLVVEPRLWMKSDTDRQCSDTDGREDTASSSPEMLPNENNIPRSQSRKERGGRGRLKGSPFHKQLFFGTQAPPGHLGHGRILQSNVSCSLGSPQPSASVSWGLHEMPPLLPTPQASETALSHADQMPRSVIQPPRHKDQSVMSLEHNPITPQLFPVSRSSSLGYSYQEVLQGKDEILAADGSSLSRSHGTPWERESGLLHISQLFPPCSSPQLFSKSDPLCQTFWPPDYLSEHGPSTPTTIGPLVANALPPHLPGNLVQSSSTLFSSPFGEKYQFSLSSCGTAFSSSSYDPLLLPSLPALNVYAQPFAPTSDSNINVLPPFVQQALSCTCDDESCVEQQESMSSPLWTTSAAACFPGQVQETIPDYKRQNILADEGCNLKTGGLTSVHQDFQQLSQVHLQQAALLDTSLGASCCVCYDRLKDAALISCGHRMCKGCAEEMHRLHHLCPVCNRMIEAVLALCS